MFCACPHSLLQWEGFLFCPPGELRGDLNGQGQFLLVVLQLSAQPVELQVLDPGPSGAVCSEDAEGSSRATLGLRAAATSLRGRAP